MTVDKSIGREPGQGGYPVGRDPREMTQDEIKALGHEPMSPLKALRLRCLDCCAGSPNEVRLCVAVTCVSWPFRMGANPWRQPVSDARREAGRRAAARMHGNASAPGTGPASDAASHQPATLLPGGP